MTAQTSLFRARAAVGIANKASMPRILRAVAGHEPARATLALTANGLRDVERDVAVHLANDRYELAYWLQYPQPDIHPAKWRCAINPPPQFVHKAERYFAIQRGVEHSKLPMLLERGEFGTVHVDDLVIFLEDSLTDETVKLVTGRLRIGSTIAICRPGVAHQFWLRFTGQACTPLTDAIQAKFKLQRVHESTTEDMVHIVYGVAALA